MREIAMSDNPSKFSMPGWLRDAAGAPLPPVPGGPTPAPAPRWKALLRWLTERLLADR